MTPEDPVTVSPAPQETATPSHAFGLLLILGLAMLATLFVGIGMSVWGGQDNTGLYPTPPRYEWLTGAAGFTPHSSLPQATQEEIRKLYESARTLADEHATSSGLKARWSQYADWLAFGLTSLIMILAGYFGRLPESGNDATAAALALQPNDKPKRGKKEKNGPRKLSSPGRFASMVGVIAALATVATGASTRLQTEAAQSMTRNKDVGDAIIKASKVSTDPTSEADLMEALEHLRATMRSNPL